MSRVVHFVYGLGGPRSQQAPLALVHYLAVASALEVLEPDRVLFHSHQPPSGTYWDLVRADVELVPVDPVPGVTERSSVDPTVARYGYAHHADVIRLDVLLEHGGAYLDIDTLTIRPFPEAWWAAPFVLGREQIPVTLADGRTTSSLLNAVMLAQPSSPFARAWREDIVDAMDGSWSAHSCELAARLTDDMADEVLVLPEDVFSRYAPSPPGLQALLMPTDPDDTGEATDLAGTYALHLCQHLWWEKQRVDFVPWLSGEDVDERYVEEGGSVYARCARRFLPAGRGRRPPTRERGRRGDQGPGALTTTPLRYVGHDSTSGYGVAARRVVRALLARGWDVDWQPVSHVWREPAGWGWYPTPPSDSTGLARSDPDRTCDVLIGHTPPDHASAYRSRFESARYVCHTVWETDRIPPTWVPLLNGSQGPVDTVIVPTEWNAATFREGGVETPILVVPHVAVPDELRSSDTPLGLDLDDDVFVFYMVSAWSRRKAVEATVEAYLRAFDASDRVALVIKTGTLVEGSLTWFFSGPPSHNETWWRLLQVLRRHRDQAHVVLAPEWWPPERLAALHRRGDCYFALPHSEGWGLGAFDAATLATPVITTGWGGPLAYLGDDYPGLVSGHLAETDEMGPDRIANWFEPDLDHAVELLRAVAADRGSGWKAEREALADKLAVECSAERVTGLIASAAHAPGRGGL